MPIKPENRHRYPPDWPAVRERILKRAGYRCEHPGCLARQYSIGIWWRRDGVHHWAEQYEPPTTYAEARQIRAEAFWEVQHVGGQPLTLSRAFGVVREGNSANATRHGGWAQPWSRHAGSLAHASEYPENCADENLRALCQRHHLAHDHEHHRANAQATRRAKSGTAELF